MRFIPICLVLVLIVSFSTVLCWKRVNNSRYKRVFKIILSVITSMFAISFVGFVVCNSLDRTMLDMRVMMWWMWGMFTVYAPMLTCALMYGVDLLISWARRREVRVMRYVGDVLAVVIIVVMVSGMLMRNKIEVREVELNFENLPSEFDEIEIVHITDLHLGCISPEGRYFDELEEMIKEIDPDMVVFTGDLVNLTWEDGDEYRDFLNGVDAPLGKYAVLGNHDYGTYAGLDEDGIEDNLIKLRELYDDMGFVLLRDFAVSVNVGAANINIVGTENCGIEHFPCYSDMEKVKGLFDEDGFNLLLSHDPNYWVEHVPNDLPYVDLMLAGHTHSAQIGMNIGDWKWSPSAWVFEAWDGLYSRDKQHLYVSRGAGYVGIPFRLGMWNEVTVVRLFSDEVTQ